MKLPFHHPAAVRVAARVCACSVIAACLLLQPNAQDATCADNSCPPAQWQPYPTPSDENLAVLPGSDIDQFVTTGGDGATVYAIGTWNSPCAEDAAGDPFAPDGFIFNARQAPRLWKSIDGGSTWEDRTQEVLEARGLPDAGGGEYDDFVAFTALATAPDDPDLVVVAGYNRDGLALVAGSRDGGTTFAIVACGDITGVVLSVAVSREVKERRQIAVGTMDMLNGGRIWRCEAGSRWPTSWTDTTAYNGWDELPVWGGDASRIHAVTSLSFSPSFATDGAMLAIVAAAAEEPDGDSYTGYYLVAGTWDATNAWNEAAGFADYPVLLQTSDHVIQCPPAIPAFLLRGMTDIALPADYDADDSSARRVLAAANGLLVNPASDSILAEGGVLLLAEGARLSDSLVSVEGNPWLSSVSYHGNATMQGRLLVGTAYPRDWSWSDIVLWFSAGSPSLPCCAGTGVLFAEGLEPCCPRWTWSERPPSGQFNTQVAWTPDGVAGYASTSGAGRLWHGEEWYADESAFSVSPLPLLGWEQSGLVDTMIHRLADIAYDPATATLHLHTSHLADAGTVCDCESVWRSSDEGATWRRELHGRPESDESDEDAFDDILGGYYRGFFKPWIEGYLQAPGVRYLIGDAIDEDDDQQVEAGFEADAVYRLRSGAGNPWQKISEFVLNYEGLIHMDCGGAQGNALYVGFDNLWWDFTANTPLPYKSDGGDPDIPSSHDCRKVSGAARALDPGRPDCCDALEWDYLIRGLVGTTESGGVYERLELAGAHCTTNFVHLWAIDDGNYYWGEEGGDSEGYDWCTATFINARWGRLWTYADCYAMTAVQPLHDGAVTIPSDPCRCAHEEFLIQWERPCDACEYELQLALDRDFTHVVFETDALLQALDAERSTRFYLPPHPPEPDILVAKGFLDCNETYWCRVRAHLAETGEVIRSWWSAPVRIDTAPGPPGLVELRAPGDGATGVPVKDVAFTWTRVSGATTYDFMLVDKERGHVASSISDATTFVLPLALKHDTPYVWRVIALDGERVITESDGATFRTEPEAASPASQVPPPPFTPPTPPAQSSWLWYFAGAIALLLLLALGALSRVNRRLRRERAAVRGTSGWRNQRS
jgi:hypothetical protein